MEHFTLNLCDRNVYLMVHYLRIGGLLPSYSWGGQHITRITANSR